MERYHDINIANATVSRILKRNGMSRLPRGIRIRKVHTKRYNKQVPGHHIQMDVKFLTFKGKRGQRVRRFQYTAIDDATRVMALKIYEKHTQVNAIDFVGHIIEKFRSVSRKSELTTAMSSKLSSIDMSKIWVFATHISNAQRRNLMAKLSDRIDQMNKSSISFSATKVTLISKPDLMNGKSFTTSIGCMEHSMEKPLTKRSERSYNDQIKCPEGYSTLQVVIGEFIAAFLRSRIL